MKLKIFQSGLVWLQIFSVSTLIGAAIFQMFVFIPEFTRDFPNGMIAVSKSTIVPGNFWGSPVVFLSTLIIPIVSIAFNWKTPRRKWLLIAFACGMTASIYTTIYFIPRLRIMGLLDSPITTDIELLKVTVDQWIFHDHLRLWFVIIPGFLCLLKAASLQPIKRRKTAEVNAVAEANYAV